VLTAAEKCLGPKKGDLDLVPANNFLNHFVVFYGD
jgi:hypothetical protein